MPASKKKRTTGAAKKKKQASASTKKKQYASPRKVNEGSSSAGEKSKKKGAATGATKERRPDAVEFEEPATTSGLLDTNPLAAIDDSDSATDAEEPTVVEVVQGETDGDITSIYDIDGEEPVDMTTFDQKRSKKAWVVGAALLVIVIGVASYLGYAIFRQDFGGEDASLELSVDVDERVASGDIVEVVVDYTNNKSVDVVEGDIEIFYPDGFLFQGSSVDAIDEFNRVFPMDELKPGESGRVRVTGQLVGEKDQEKEFSALATYQPENFSNDFQETATDTTTITSSTLTVQIEVPAQVGSDQEFEYLVRFTNTATIPLQQVRATLDAPEIFETRSSSPERTSGLEWTFDELAPGEEQEIRVTGVLAGKSGKTKELTMQIGLVEIDGSFNVQVEKTSLVVIIDPELTWSIEAPEVVRRGESVTITATLQNASETTIRDVTPVFQLEGDLFDQTEHRFSALEELKPFAEETLSYTTSLQDDGSTIELVVTATVDGGSVEGTEVELDATATHTMKLGGSLTVQAEGRYFDDDLTRIGSGPLPPVVNAETSYVVVWTVENGANALSDFSMTTTLPADVIWKNEASNAIEYNATTRQVSYTRESVAADSEKTVSFEVSVSPIGEDLNKLLPLTGETVITAVDENTGEEISRTEDRITTDLPNDEGAKGKGVVESS